MMTNQRNLLLQMHKNKTFDLANEKEHNRHDDSVRWQISNSLQDVLQIYVLAFTVSELLTFQIFYLENLGKGLEVQHSQ